MSRNLSAKMEILRICNSLFKRDIMPTIGKVREARGGIGSNQTISLYLNDWKRTNKSNLENLKAIRSLEMCKYNIIQCEKIYKSNKIGAAKILLNEVMKELKKK